MTKSLYLFDTSVRPCADETFRPGIRCYDNKHIVMLVIAVILIITVVFGLPLLTISLLRSVRSTVRSSDPNFWRRYAMTYVLFDNRQYVVLLDAFL